MIDRLPNQFTADPTKVLLQFFDLNYDRIELLLKNMHEMPDEIAKSTWQQTLELFSHRHRDYIQKLDFHVQKVEHIIQAKIDLSSVKRSLLGAYLSKEYSTQSAALFNPSIVLHPNQEGLQKGAIRFLLSLRSTGEGHISSISFKEGILDENGHIEFAHQSRWQSTGEILNAPVDGGESYQVTFSENIPGNERVLFPVSPHESMGMEDLRLVRFSNEGAHRYIGTYTAYNGRSIQSKILQTDDFISFELQSLTGNASRGKGIAIFPRKIRDKYVAIGRQDGVNMSIMYSDKLTHWDTAKLLQAPTEPHEFIQLGNCGSPIETARGWILLTHAVGPMRRYVLGVSLLDLEHPEKIIAKLTLPLLSPIESEREGYVPNVLYTCGFIRHQDILLIPYAMSDASCGFASVSVNELLDQLSLS